MKQFENFGKYFRKWISGYFICLFSVHVNIFTMLSLVQIEVSDWWKDWRELSSYLKNQHSNPGFIWARTLIPDMNKISITTSSSMPSDFYRLCCLTRWALVNTKDENHWRYTDFRKQTLVFCSINQHKEIIKVCKRLSRHHKVF